MHEQVLYCSGGRSYAMSFQHLVLFYMWVAPHVWLIPILFVGVRRGRHKEFPIFFSYVIFQELVFGILFPGWLLKMSASTYIRIDILSRIGDIVLRFAVIQEVFDSPLANSILLRQKLAVVLRWITVVLLMLEALSAAIINISIPGFGILSAHWILQACETTQCGLLVMVFLWYSFLRIRMSSMVFGIALGMGLMLDFSLWHNVGLLLHETSRHSIDYDILLMAGYHIVILIWLYFVQTREEKDPEFDANQLLNIRDWLDGVEKLTYRRKDDPFAIPNINIIAVLTIAFLLLMIFLVSRG
ncbi:MAG: hypothetical protein WBS24_02935 [Terriglobales bacterium]